MSNQKSFIGAYSRNRRVAQKTASQARVEEQQPTSDHAPPTVPPQPHLSSIDQPALLDQQELFAQIDTVDVLIQQSVSVADTGALPQQHWLEQDSGEMLRIDTVHPHVQDVPEQNAPAPSGANKNLVVAELPHTDPNDQLAIPTIERSAESNTEPSAESIAEPSAEIATEPSAEIATEPSAEVASEPVVASTAESPTPLPESYAADVHVHTASAPLAMQPDLDQPQWAGAAWEVDAFEIPHHVAELFFAEDFFRSIAEHMGRSVQDGLRSVLVTSTGTQNGRSTVAIGTAIAAAATGIRVALVDINIDSSSSLPGGTQSTSAAEKLRLEVVTDWVEVIRQGDSLENAAILSLEDGLTLLPLAKHHTLPIASVEIDQLVDLLSDCFDLVLFDGPTIDCWATGQVATKVDASLIVRDTRTTSLSQVESAAETLRHRGVQGIGVVDNFCN